MWKQGRVSSAGSCIVLSIRQAGGWFFITLEHTKLYNQQLSLRRVGKFHRLMINGRMWQTLSYETSVESVGKTDG